MNSLVKTDEVIYICAVDSSEEDKKSADFVCTGKDDQDIIQKAVDSIALKKCGEIRGIKIILLPGNYYISAFPRANSNGRVAVLMGDITRYYQSFRSYRNTYKRFGLYGIYNN